jgi:hypothetical protein
MQLLGRLPGYAKGFGHAQFYSLDSARRLVWPGQAAMLVLRHRCADSALSCFCSSTSVGMLLVHAVAEGVFCAVPWLLARGLSFPCVCTVGGRHRLRLICGSPVGVSRSLSDPGQHNIPCYTQHRAAVAATDCHSRSAKYQYWSDVSWPERLFCFSCGSMSRVLPAAAGGLLTMQHPALACSRLLC